MKNATLTFTALCFAAYGVQLLDEYALLHIGDGGIIVSLDFIGVAVFLALLGWSIGSVIHHRFRAVTGLIVCGLCIWQFMANRTIIW
jgi:hypothetical protein